MNDFAPTFTFKEFAVDDRRCAMKVGTDGVLLGAWAQCPETLSPAIVDIGAGSGLIALMLAQRYAQARITAVELSPDAFSDLEKNIANSSFDDRITPLLSDFRDLTGSFDLIVSNPPFFAPGAPIPDSGRLLAREAGSLSPLNLLSFAPRHLTEDGLLAMIAPSDLDNEIEFNATLNHFYIARRTAVSTSPRRGVTRTLWEFSLKPSPQPVPDSITVGSESYRALTSPFYLNY